ncbi:SdpI family protein [bacterium 210917-SL.2.15]|nr:SdpI family protein [bacterium 210917-SL.2.15]
MSKKERILSWILLVLCAAPILAAVAGVQFLPDQIPVHYNDVGEIERWGSKYEELILGVAFSLSGWILWLVSRFSGVFADTETERVQAQANAHIVRIAGIAVQLFLTVLEVVMLIGAAREAATAAVVSSVPLYKIIGIGCGLLFLVLGNIMPKAKPNPIMGVRLPWLEGHPEAWRKSQRAGGIAFAAAGAICLVLSLLLQGFVLFWVIMICALGAAAVSCIVSLRFSRE